jgi:hypothetical protein
MTMPKKIKNKFYISIIVSLQVGMYIFKKAVPLSNIAESLDLSKISDITFTIIEISWRLFLSLNSTEYFVNIDIMSMRFFYLIEILLEAFQHLF